MVGITPRISAGSISLLGQAGGFADLQKLSLRPRLAAADVLRLHRALGVKAPLGLLAVTLHRDDFGRIGLHREARRSHLPFEVEGRAELDPALLPLVDIVGAQHLALAASLDRGRDPDRPAGLSKVTLTR